MAQARGLTVDADFPGGNIVVDGIESDRIWLHQDIRDTTEWWFYWHFRFTIPYQASDLHTFLARHADHPDLRTDILCRTGEEREVEVLTLGAPAGPQHWVLLTARHHACESLASYSLEGLMEVVLADSKAGRWLREHVTWMVVPFADRDGVEDGDQGKSRAPHDHNRDYGTYVDPAAPSLYAVPAALRKQVPSWSAGTLRIALDFHCPWIRGEHNEAIYFVGSPNKDHWARVTAFASVLERVQAGPLPYHREDNLPFGEAWNTVDNVAEGRPFSRWAAQLSGVKVASTIEIPYANVGSVTVTADRARAFGADVAQAIWQYLKDLDSK